MHLPRNYRQRPVFFYPTTSSWHDDLTCIGLLRRRSSVFKYLLWYIWISSKIWVHYTIFIKTHINTCKSCRPDILSEMTPSPMSAGLIHRVHSDLSHFTVHVEHSQKGPHYHSSSYILAEGVIRLTIKAFRNHHIYPRKMEIKDRGFALWVCLYRPGVCGFPCLLRLLGQRRHILQGGFISY